MIYSIYAVLRNRVQRYNFFLEYASKNAKKIQIGDKKKRLFGIFTSGIMPKFQLRFTSFPTKAG